MTLADFQRGPSVQEQDALQPQQFFAAQVVDLVARHLFQGVGPGFEKQAHRLPLLSAVRLTGRAAEVGLDHLGFRGGGIPASDLAPGAPDGSAHVGGFFPTTQTLPILSDHVDHVFQPVGEKVARPLSYHLPAIHEKPSLVDGPPASGQVSQTPCGQQVRRLGTLHRDVSG